MVDGRQEPENLLAQFSPVVREWFLGAFEGPTAVQAQAWEAVSSGQNVLVVAPTGSGKTLAAFLHAIDRLFRQKTVALEDEAEKPKRRKKNKGVKTLYISPLKALGADVERNLQRPLAGITQKMEASEAAGGLALAAVPEVTVAQRTGDTTPDERRRIVSNPPDILITTPESLYLMLTSQAREVLRTVETVIVDEVHALAGNKRGAHLSLSLERLDQLLEHPVRRVGLSATVRPVQEVARFLGGPHPVTVVQDGARPQLDVQVSVPVADMTAIPAFGGTPFGKAHRGGEASFGPRRTPAEAAWKSDKAMRAMMANNSLGPTPDSRAGGSSIWPYLENDILDTVLAHRSTIVFVNSRGLCEKLTARLNELYARRTGGKAVRFVDAGYWSAVGSADTRGPRTAGDGPGPEASEADNWNAGEGVAGPGDKAVGIGCQGSDWGTGEMDAAIPQAYRSDIGASTSLLQGAPEVVAKAHHGSVSKEKRREVEQALKAGELPCVVATSSLELGIDMGDVDLVIQVAPPPSVASGLQRIGRANHQVGGCSQAVFLPRTRNEVVDMAVMSEGMREGRLEPTHLVENALDVLAQQTVAAVAMEDWAADSWFSVVRCSACFRCLPRAAFDGVLAMLAGEYTEGVLAKVPPRLSWNRETGQLTAKPGAQRAAVGAAGTIPDRGMFPVVLPQGDGVSGRKRVGELDEEMVMESRVGDIITLGTSTWKIREITADRVMVDSAPGRSSRLPFWHGEAPSRPFEAGLAKGRFLQEAQRLLEEDEATGKAAAEDATAGPSSFGGSSAPVPPALLGRLRADGLDEYACQNLVAALRAQKAATGVVPTATVLVAEQCEDETGDMRLIMHSPYGRAVHEPWALAVSARIKALYHFDAQVMAGDDGILVQWPVSEGAIPGVQLFRFSVEEASSLVQSSVQQTSLFAARFRECAARALLMPPTAAGKRAPLWLQRLKGGQLLEAARQYENFPMCVEALRECLQDVFDMRAFEGLMASIEADEVRFVEARTAVPSPFASSLLFGYMAEHLYEGDLPHAEKAASLLSVEPVLLGEILGTAETGHLLDPAVVAGVEAQLQRTAPGWQRKGAQGIEALLRELGPLTEEQLLARCSLDEGETAGQALEELFRQHRAFSLEMGGVRKWAFVSDGPQLAGLLGADVPEWATAAKTATTAAGARPLDGLVRRYAATHGPFSAQQLAAWLGIGEHFVQESLARLQASGSAVPVQFGEPPASLWVDPQVLQRLRRLSAEALEQAAAPVPAARFQEFVLERQGVCGEESALQPIEAAAEVVAQFEGAYLPFELWDKVVFPARVPGWRRDVLEQLITDGEVLWAARAGDGAGTLAVAFFPTDSPLAPLPVSGGAQEAPFTFFANAPGEQAAMDPGSTGFGPVVGGRVACEGGNHEPGCEPGIESACGEDTSAIGEATPLRQTVVRLLGVVGPLALPQLTELARNALPKGDVSAQAVIREIDVLVGEGRLTSGRLEYLASDRMRSGEVARPGGTTASPWGAPSRKATSRRGRRAMERQFKTDYLARQAAQQSFNAAYGGVWTLLEPSSADPTLQAVGLVEGLLDRYGVVTADIVLAAGIPGGFGGLYPVLRSMEDAGELLRGRFVEGLGPVQFASREVVEQLRSHVEGASNPDSLLAGSSGEPLDDGRAVAHAETVRPDAGTVTTELTATPARCDEGGRGMSLTVLPAEDPALLFGSALPWPDGLKPQKRPGSLVVLKGGAPVLFAAPRLRAITLFSEDEAVAAEAIGQLCAFEVARLRREGSLAKAKLVVETVNGQSALEPGPSQLLAKAGFVRHPDGMRYYPQLF
ncbi:DNA glycosylase AlkZ-like family protein [Parvibacter caecicola]|uniref:DNA glycosylase AlkZ-like family protein n=1 Tax=Parvibacter caecicola TaxID=747645 RepID=UPI0023EF5CAB|nr:crosslink repair DNA glycosylase YcaQ family protein [Parvibacter caecicola]